MYSLTFSKFRVMSVLQTFLKCIIVVINTLLLVFGIGTIVIGIMALYDMNVVTFLFDSVVYSSTLTFIGCILCVVSICGILGVLVPSRVFMSLYTLFILLFTLTSIILCITAVVQKGLYTDYNVYKQRALRAYFEEYKQTGYLLKCRTTGMCDHIVDLLQFRWHCCGLDDIHFWISDKDNTTLIIPASCCLPTDPHPCQEKDIFKDACGPKGFSKFHQDLVYFEISFCVLFLLFLFVFIIMVYLISAYREEFYLDITQSMENQIHRPMVSRRI